MLRKTGKSNGAAFFSSGPSAPSAANDTRVTPTRAEAPLTAYYPSTKGGVGGSPVWGLGVRRVRDLRADLSVDGRRPRREPSRGGGHARADRTM